MSKPFDIIVLGGGPGGYPAAIHAAQLGQKVALVEAESLGGTCLNRGCIPSKALIAGAEMLQLIKKAQTFGIETGPVSFDYSQMVARKDEVVTRLRKGLEGLIAANKITWFRGFGVFESANTVRVGDDLLQAGKIIIATGSEPRAISTFAFDGTHILDSTALLNRRTLPQSLAIIGGGVIGCEFASLFHMLGVKITVLEMMPTLLPMEAANVAAFLTKTYKQQGIQVETNAKVEGVLKRERGVEVLLAEGKKIEAELCLVAVGRTMNTAKIGLEKTGVKCDEKGHIRTNAKMETSVSGIYAIGDIASKWWLAHVATHQGIVAASNACNRPQEMHYNAIPSVIFTHPEIATCGLSFEEAQKQGFSAKSGQFPFAALGKAQAMHATAGFAEIVIDTKTGQILGAQVVGPEASTLIAEMAVSIQNELTIECLLATLHAHPTLSEIWLEAAFMVSDQPLHLPKR